ncbi:tetratricopeptide repeat protein [Rugamonas sp. CCM 8940]|nr:tetratricopeptide repeat protein [Rugamonas sp. CCM 8940]
MQALKKAERAKQNSSPEAELEKPSEAFDEVLSLAPLEQPAAAPRAESAGLSLSPLAEAGLTPPHTPPHTLMNTPMHTPQSTAPSPSSAAAPTAPLEFAVDGLPPIPVLNVAAEVIHDPVPPQARHHGAEPAAAPAASHAPAQGNAGGQPGHAAGAAKASAAKPAPRSGARARAAAPAEARAGLEPATLRLIGLGSLAAVIALVFGYMYWQGVYGSGSGARLPMVPMPPLNATGATGATVVVAAQQDGAAESTPAPAEAAAAPPREALMAQQLAEAQARLQQLAQAPPAPRAEALPPVVAADSGDIKVQRHHVAPQLNPALQSGYQAFNGGDLAQAREQYDAVLRQDQNNRDALLGLAALALRQRQDQQAAGLYARLLELDPNDAEALAGLIGLRQGDPGQNELRLKKLLQGAPDSAPLLFALGNLYARQGRWPEAQPLYFNAFGAAPANADYAFNLAVALDRLNQPKLALNYYQRALALAQSGPANFDPAALRRRTQELGAAAEAAGTGAPTR